MHAEACAVESRPLLRSLLTSAQHSVGAAATVRAHVPAAATPPAAAATQWLNVLNNMADELASVPLKKDGTPDLRYSKNRD